MVDRYLVEALEVVIIDVDRATSRHPLIVRNVLVQTVDGTMKSIKISKEMQGIRCIETSLMSNTVFLCRGHTEDQERLTCVRRVEGPTSVRVSKILTIIKAILIK